MRDAVENGFKILVVKDATGPPGEEMVEAAQTNYEMIAHETAEADDVTSRLTNAASAVTAEDE